MALTPYQNIFNSYVQKTPDGRYFVPLSATQYGWDIANPNIDPETGRPTYTYTTPTGGGDSGYDPIRQQFGSLNDYYNAIDPSSIQVTGGLQSGNAQVALGLNGNGLTAEQLPGMSQRGSYGDQLGYYVDPKYFSGLNPATTGGGKPNDIGLWQALSVIAPAAFGVGSFALDQAAAGATSLGTEAGSAAGDIGGSAGTTSLAGNAGADTLGTDVMGGYQTDPATGDVTGTATTGGGMDNYFGDYITDPNTGDVTSATSDVSGGVDAYGNPTSGNLNFTGGGTNDFYNPFAVDASGAATGSLASDPNYLALAKQYGPTAAKYLYNYISGNQGGQKQTVGQGILGQLTGDPMGSAFSSLPFLLALHESDRQSGDINNAITRMRALEDSVSGNASPYMRSILDPYDMATAEGRTNLMQDQTLRNIRGSSFGDQSINNYDYTRGLGRGDIAARALQGSTALQGNLINSELGAVNARNTNRNLLLGAGLNASGKLFSPQQQDPFNLAALLGLGGSQ